MRMTDVARAVAANTKSANILTDKVGRVINRPSRIRVIAAGSGVGMRMTILLQSQQLGTETVLDDQEIPGTNRFPLLLEDYVTEFGATGPTDELFIFLRNTTVGALTATTAIDIDPVA